MLTEVFSSLTGHESIAVVALSVCLVVSIAGNWIQYRNRERLNERVFDLLAGYTELATRSTALFERLENYLVRNE